MENEKKQLRLWQGLLVIILAGLEVFGFSSFLPQWLGMGRSLIGELILLGTAVGAVAVFHGNFRSVFPINTATAHGDDTDLPWCESGNFCCDHD